MGCAKFVIFFSSISSTTSPSSLLVHRSSHSLCLLDFLRVLALGNELLGEVVSQLVFPDDEGAVKKFSDTLQRKNEDEGPIYYYYQCR